MIQRIEDAMMCGRCIVIAITVAVDEDGVPVADWSVMENGKHIASDLNCDSIEQALKEINEVI